jgi:hypothetical protein
VEDEDQGDLGAKRVQVPQKKVVIGKKNTNKKKKKKDSYKKISPTL